MSLKVIGHYEQLLDIVESEQIDKIIVTLPDRRGKLPVSDLLICKMRGIEVEDVTTFREKFNHKIMLDTLQPSWMIFSSDFTVSPFQRLFKRLSDIVLASLGLVLATPLMLLVTAIVKLGSPGPIFFVQERVGQYGHPFVLIKFRSMYTDAEIFSGPVFAQQRDPRIAPLGGWLRRLRLDELPQLFNILSGDMSFVGPRPERDYFVKQFQREIPFYMQRLSVKPGLTGWAQVNYPYGETIEDTIEKLQLDLYYIKNMSLFLDLLILLKTVKTILLMRGSR
jgi:sugar transferase (PEP-CTERM system associated)